jgi:hypothetical protein
MTEQDILKFIKGFTEVKDFFLFGYCYWFAVILSEQFMGQICYLPIKNHFITRIHNIYYDASGRVIPDEQVYSWAYYQYKFPSECKSIVRGCINKTE